ncbi:MAG TPA: AMP-binding protein [Micropepsaceae bacterium]|nr:AMP-binding protein [Micropepsaceae bacterium]
MFFAADLPLGLGSASGKRQEEILEELHSTYDPKRAQRTVFGALLQARGTFGAQTPILVDGDDRILSYQDIVRASFALGRALKTGTNKCDAVGVLLPTGIGSVLSFFALSAYGRVPAMLNFTAGTRSLTTALETARVKRIVTAHRFIEVGKFEALEAALKPLAELVYLEDIRDKLSALDKGAAVVGSILPAAIASHVSPNAPAVILFTSGTEGEPKGVALSHANLLANVEQVRAHVELSTKDIVFNPLPTFHSFGLTVGALMPLYLGIKAVMHPSPRQPHEIARRIRDHRATILLATDTFVSQYARAAEAGDLDSLRLAVCGAEHLRDETRQLFRRKYRVELLEGYGVTEAAPVVAANQVGANRAGTVGHVLPAIETRIEPVEGIKGAGRLFVRGPNVMLGYMSAAKPGEIVPPVDGWHDTGDVVALDEDGYLAIRGRLKRFAKIGGETVSLTVVENCASALWPDHAHAAISVPDGRKGEAIVLATTNTAASRAELVAWVHNHGVPELAVPKRILAVSDIPVLGTGKTDYVGVAAMVTEQLETVPPAPAVKSANL